MVHTAQDFSVFSLVVFGLLLALLSSGTLRAAEGEGGEDAAEAVSPHLANRPLMRDFMGINGNIGKFRPQLYAKTCRLVRDYHNGEWDYGDSPANETTYPMTRLERASGGVFAGGLNWLEGYHRYLASGYRINACIQTPRTPMENWGDHEANAYRLGRTIAEYFGPSGENKLIETIQVENEPKQQDAEFYAEHLRAFGRGVRDGDPAIRIVTCNIQAGEPDRYSKPTSVLEGSDEYYDVIAVHTYALADHWPTYRRSFPEDPINVFLRRVKELIEWRDAHAADKPIWVTEFGWDATTAPTPTEYPQSAYVDVSDTQQAQYIVRAFMVFSAMPIERAYLFYFNDANGHSVHKASGITRNDYQPKASFHAMQHLFETLGDYRFSRAMEAKDHYLYLYEYVRDGDENDHVYAVWSPSGHAREFITEFELPARPWKAERMPLEAGPAPSAVYEVTDEGKIKLTVTESPTYFWVRTDGAE